MSNETKKLEFSNRLFIALVILILGILGYFVAMVIYKFKTIEYPREMTVTAEGRAFAKPDIALVKLGVTTEGLEVKTVVKDNTEKMNAILREIKALGIEEKDIRTLRYNLTPRYEEIEGKKTFKDYLLEQEVRIKIRNLEKIGEVIARATEKGANLVGDLFFTIDDPESIREQAREEAIRRAKIKAEKIVQETGIKLEKLINVYEDYVHYPPLIREYGSISPTPSVPEVQPGEEEVVVRINLVYRVK